MTKSDEYKPVKDKQFYYKIVQYNHLSFTHMFCPHNVQSVSTVSLFSHDLSLLFLAMLSFHPLLNSFP